jgi:hypothetical protein
MTEIRSPRQILSPEIDVRPIRRGDTPNSGVYRVSCSCGRATLSVVGFAAADHAADAHALWHGDQGEYATVNAEI